MLRTSVFVLAFACCLKGSQQAALVAEIRDLGHPLNERSLFWPTNPYGFQYGNLFKGNTAGNYWLFKGEFKSVEHVSTHVDAPLHMAAGTWSLSDIPPEHLVAPGCVIDVSSKTEDNPDYQLSVKDIQDWEKKHGSIAGSIILIKFGWAKHYSNSTHYFCGPNGSGLGPHGNDTSDLHFPGIHPDAAKWIVDNRPTVRGVGVDGPSFDYGPSTDFMTHRTLFKKNIWGIENLASLDGLPATGMEITALPVKIEGGSGGPVRVLAKILKKPSNVGSSAMAPFSVSSYMCALLLAIEILCL